MKESEVFVVLGMWISLLYGVQSTQMENVKCKMKKKKAGQCEGEGSSGDGGVLTVLCVYLGM